MESLIGTTIDKYQILEKLGEGGMGIVYKAKDIILDREVALKIINPTMIQNRDLSIRFLREAKSLAKIDHPNIVTVYDFRQSEFGSFIVMQYIAGITLADLVAKKGAISWQDSLPIFRQILNAIGHAHREGVIHRDLKPRNILLTPTNQVKVTDFGLAKIKKDTELTITMFRAGTLCYMSPEHVKGLKNVNHLSDIYSAGIILYEMLIGKKPLGEVDSDYELQQMIVRGQIPSPAKYNPAIPGSLVKIILKAIQKNPSKRFQSPGEMLNALDKFEDDQTLLHVKGEPTPVPAHKLKQLMVVGFASVVVLFFLVFMLIKRDKSVPPEELKTPPISKIIGSTQNIDQIPVVDDAVKNRTIKAGDRFLRIGIVKKKSFGNQIVQQFDNFQGNFLKQIGPEGEYISLYLGPVHADLSDNEIITQYGLENIDWGLKQILVVQFSFDKQRQKVTLEFDRSFSLP